MEWGGLLPELLPEGGGWVSGWEVGVSSGGVWSGGGRTPPPKMATAAVGMHPTGMHSCYRLHSVAKQGSYRYKVRNNLKNAKYVGFSVLLNDMEFTP